MKRVLCFPSSLRTDIFKDLIKYGQEAKGWNVGLIFPRDKKKTEIFSEILNLGAKRYIPPDFYSEKNAEEIESEKLKIIIKECENATSLSASRIILNGERAMGKAYSEGLYYLRRSRLQKASLSDNTYPEKVVLRIFQYVIKVFEEFRPELIISVRYGSPLVFATYLYSKRSNIPHIVLQHSRVLKNRMFWTNDFLLHNPFIKNVFDNKLENNTEASDESYDYMTEFRKKPFIASYVASEKLGILSKRTWLDTYKGFYSAFTNNIPVLPKIYDHYRIKLMQLCHRKFFKSYEADDLKKIKYIYYPLHLEPEMMLNQYAALWHNQRHTTKFISTMLPIGYKLIVREHIKNWGRRYKEYYKYLTRLPSVILVGPLESQFKYIQNADLIITDNGSTGWEGLLLKKPVITLEKTFYDVPGLSIQATKPSKLDKYILKALNDVNVYKSNEYDCRLRLFIDAEDETTLSVECNAEDHVQMINRLLN